MRYSVRLVRWPQGSQGWPHRTAAYLEKPAAFFVPVTRAALAKAGIATRKWTPW